MSNFFRVVVKPKIQHMIKSVDPQKYQSKESKIEKKRRKWEKVTLPLFTSAKPLENLHFFEYLSITNGRGIELLQFLICLSIIMILPKFKPNIIEILRSFAIPLHTAAVTNSCFSLRFLSHNFIPKANSPEEYFLHCISYARKQEKKKNTHETKLINFNSIFMTFNRILIIYQLFFD